MIVIIVVTAALIFVFGVTSQVVGPMGGFRVTASFDAVAIFVVVVVLVFAMLVVIVLFVIAGVVVATYQNGMILSFG